MFESVSCTKVLSNVIDFYFDFSSPYGYLAAQRIGSIAQKHHCTVNWRPILLGAVFKVTGQAPLTEAPMKGDYAIMDFARSAREHSIKYNHPEVFPIGAVAACRATLWLRDNEDKALSQQTEAFVQAIFSAYYIENKDITKPETLGEIAQSLKIDSELMQQALSEQSVKDALRTEVEGAIELGVFGSPMMIINGEKFWGHDRLEQMERWLQSGGW